MNLEVDFGQVALDSESGIFSIALGKPEWFFDNFMTSIVVDGHELVSTDSTLERRVEINKGKKLARLICTKEKLVRFWIEFGFDEMEKIITCRAYIENLSNKEIKLSRCWIMKSSEKTGIYSPTGKLWTITNGNISWTTHTVAPVGVEEIESYWNIGYIDRGSRESTVLGFLQGLHNITSFRTKKLGDGRCILDVLCDFNDVLLPPGKHRQTDVLAILSRPSLNDALSNYGDLLAKYNEVDLWDHTPCGWCSWYYYYGNVREEHITGNTDLASKKLSDVGFEYVQIDDGYQPAHGDWWNNEKFPHGLEWLAKYIKERGFIPGIWVAPFWVVPKAENYKKHENIILKLDENVYVWDISTQEARDWLKATFSQIKAWGYDYVKIDFLLWAYNSLDDRANKYMTKTEAYREALKAIREGVGEDTFILGCGAPMLPSIGIVNGMRIGPDVATDWGVILNCVNPTATRWFYHRRVWDNDPDCLVVREPLTEEQARTWASLIAISGGMVLESDNMQELPAKRLEIVRKCMPAYGKAGVPLDLDETALPTKWLLTLEDNTYIVGLFNWDAERWQKLELDLDEILPVAGPFLVYSVWDEEFLGERAKFVFDMPPATCKVLAVTKKASHPVVLATNRHILARAVDVDKVSWSRQNRTLTVNHKNVWRGKYKVILWVPEGFHLEELHSPIKANIEAAGNIITVEFARPKVEFSWSAKFSR